MRKQTVTTTILPQPFLGNHSLGFGNKAKIGASFLMLFLVATISNAQDLSSGVTAINEAADGISPYFDAVETIVYVVAAIIALLGGSRIFMKWNMGDPDVMSSAAAWFGSVVFLLVSVTIVRGFFGI